MTDFAAARTAMVDTQVRPSDVTRLAIIQAMLAVPREDFVPAALRPVAYLGEHVPLAPGRVLLDPRVFAKMIDALDLGPSDRVLDVGCGLGYSAAVIARLAGTVVALEEEPALAREAAGRLSGQGTQNATVAEGPLAAGLAGQGPYDAIILEGAVETLPEAIAEQLAPGGRIVALCVEGQAGQVRLGLRPVHGSGQAVGWRRIFDATAPVLPGFARTKAFEF
jgi:protein-L-isoaspartate(D-aspartate) O-methyltransferase